MEKFFYKKFIVKFTLNFLSFINNKKRMFLQKKLLFLIIKFSGISIQKFYRHSSY